MLGLSANVRGVLRRLARLVSGDADRLAEVVATAVRLAADVAWLPPTYDHGDHVTSGAEVPGGGPWVSLVAQPQQLNEGLAWCAHAWVGGLLTGRSQYHDNVEDALSQAYEVAVAHHNAVNADDAAEVAGVAL